MKVIIYKVFLLVTVWLSCWATYAEALDHWSQYIINQITPDNVVYGNGTFVAVSELEPDDFGMIYFSIDGRTWLNAGPTYAFYDVYSVSYGAGRFVAVGWSGTIYYSDNGANWQWCGLNDKDFTFTAIAYGNGLFASTGFDYSLPGHPATDVYISTNGIQWTAQPCSLGWPNSIVFGNGQFVVLARDMIVTSQDGYLWTNISANVTSLPLSAFNLKDITFGDGKFVILNTDHSIVPWRTTVLETSNGNDWTQSVEFSNRWPIKIIYGNGTFVAYGGRTLLTSYDLINWRERNLETTNDLVRAVFGAGSLYVFGPNGLVFQSDRLGPRMQVNSTSDLVIQGFPGSTYRIEATAQLGSNQSWQTLTNVILLDDSLVWRDPQIKKYKSRFYRAILLP